MRTFSKSGRLVISPSLRGPGKEKLKLRVGAAAGTGLLDMAVNRRVAAAAAGAWEQGSRSDAVRDVSSDLPGHTDTDARRDFWYKVHRTVRLALQY